MENAETEFIDVHNYSNGYEKRLKSFKTDKAVLPANRKLILAFLKDCKLGKTIKNKAKKKLGPARLLKYINLLSRLSQWFGKPFDQVTIKDMEGVVSDLESGKYKKIRVKIRTIKTKTGKKRIVTKTETEQPLADDTKVDFKNTIKKFYRWLLGETPGFFELTNWIETYTEEKEIRALTREEIEKVANACKIRDRAMIMALFDSGARIEEFLNLRIGDLTRKDTHFMVRIKHSKTKPRTISLPMSTEALNNWLAAHPNKNNPQAPLFPVNYDTVRKILNRTTQAILEKNANPHLLRHSSVTYYCHKLNQYQLCYRYGWSMASKQPQRYIDREGINEEETAKLVKQEDTQTLKNKIREMEEAEVLRREALLKELEKLKALERALEKDKKFFEELANRLKPA